MFVEVNVILNHFCALIANLFFFFFHLLSTCIGERHKTIVSYFDCYLNNSIGLNLMKLPNFSVSLLPKTASEFLVLVFIQ